MSAREIKDLAIAREALSRIPGSDAVTQSEHITQIMYNMIVELGREQAERANPPKRVQPSMMDDDIPF